MLADIITDELLYRWESIANCSMIELSALITQFVDEILQYAERKNLTEEDLNAQMLYKLYSYKQSFNAQKEKAESAENQLIAFKNEYKSQLNICMKALQKKNQEIQQLKVEIKGVDHSISCHQNSVMLLSGTRSKIINTNT